MLTAEEGIPKSSGRLFGPAEVLELDSTGEYLRVAAGDWNPHSSVWARSALGHPAVLPQVHDLVLVTGERSDELYVIGLLSVSRIERLQTASGEYAERGRSPEGGETLRVMSAKNELLFELDSAAGRTRLSLPEGSLEVTALKGDLLLRSAGAVRVQGQSVELQAGNRLSLSVSQGLAAAGSWLRLLPQTIRVSSEQVEVAVAHSEVRTGTAAVTGKQITLQTDQIQLKSRQLEIVADTLIERLGSVYRTVRDLVQLQTGRLRTYVSGLCHFRSRRAYFSSEETFQIDGDKVQLG